MTLEGDERPRRRRGAALEAALLDAVWDELVARGYSDLTFEGVAARAGTSRSVLYRRWATKRDLALAAVAHQGDRRPPLHPDTGTLRGDLLVMLRDLNERRAPAMAFLAAEMGAVYREAGITPEGVREYWLGGRGAVVDEVVAHAVARGEVDPARVTPRVLRLPSDLLRHDILMTMSAASDEAIVRIVDEIVLPLLTAPVRAPGPPPAG